jgi:hypothetical protein
MVSFVSRNSTCGKGGGEGSRVQETLISAGAGKRGRGGEGFSCVLRTNTLTRWNSMGLMELVSTSNMDAEVWIVCGRLGGARHRYTGRGRG